MCIAEISSPRGCVRFIFDERLSLDEHTGRWSVHARIRDTSRLERKFAAVDLRNLCGRAVTQIGAALVTQSDTMQIELQSSSALRPRVPWIVVETQGIERLTRYRRRLCERIIDIPRIRYGKPDNKTGRNVRIE